MKLNILLVSCSLIAYSLTFTACSTKNKSFTSFEKPEDGKGMVYIYRPSSFVGNGFNYDIKNDKNGSLGILKNGSFLFKQMEVGDRTLYTKNDSTELIQIKVVKNEIICIKGGVNINNKLKKPTFNNVSLEQCQREILSTRSY